MKSYTLFSYNESKEYLQDGIYCSLYNKENSIVRIKDKVPVLIQFIDNSRIYDPKGILLSSLEILISL